MKTKTIKNRIQEVNMLLYQIHRDLLIDSIDPEQAEILIYEIDKIQEQAKNIELILKERAKL
ncbi:MAG: hypothetical protein PHU98_06360 [Mariniphaga sp.]|nr:hypothetical protein [Paludibacter sp.]MDD4225994.1 hypothetical protein [Mariniphaga sp.]